MNEVGLGKALQLARLSKGLTQQQLCQRASLSYSTLAKIERGAIKAPSIFTIQKIANTLELKLSEILENVAGSKTISSKKTSRSGIKFVYLDINGCLVRFYHRAFTKIAHQFSISSEDVETVFWHYNDDVCRGDITLSEFNEKLSEDLKIEKINFFDYYISSVEAMPGMFELVNQIASDYKIGLISDIMPGFIDGLMSKKLIPKITFDSIIDSSVVMAIKPELKIFQLAEQRTGLPPSDILLIDDSRSNLAAADKMGWHVIWFNDTDPDDSIQRIKTALEIS
ncbi:MAG TPA: HAD-IA family hydrolase [Candidatus Dormibacteraeota bacterium]|nr:HAD-IA family hydrolase [Candidatus Dormibacteraeota bacterium]